MNDRRGWGPAYGLPLKDRIIVYSMWTILLPLTLLGRLILFGRITDRETPVDKIRDKIFS